MNIYESIVAIMNDDYAIAKDKKNQQQGFKYRGIDDVMNTFYPLLSKYKVFVVPEVVDRQREERDTKQGGHLIYSVLTIKYTFYAEDGSNVSAVVVGEGMDSGDKASNKAMAVGMKYALFQTFCIPTEEMEDPDATTPPPSTPKAPEKKEPEKPAAKPAPKTDEIKFTCAKCGHVLQPLTRKDGTQMSVREFAGWTEKELGQVYCLRCVNEHYPDSLAKLAEAQK
jgi:hypothetical protein